MSYNGMASVEDRANLISYLRSLDDDPAPLPTEEEIAAVAEASAEGAADETQEMAEGGAEAAADMAEEATDETGGGGLATMIAEASADTGQKVARACGACHSFDKGGPTKVGPNLYNVVGAPIASDEGYSYSGALQEKGAEGMEWTYSNLNAFLENPRGWAEGTKMTYNGVKDAGDRAALIAYLRQQADNPPPLEE
jgi:cytochrome c